MDTKIFICNSYFIIKRPVSFSGVYTHVPGCHLKSLYGERTLYESERKTNFVALKLDRSSYFIVYSRGLTCVLAHLRISLEFLRF